MANQFTNTEQIKVKPTVTSPAACPLPHLQIWPIVRHLIEVEVWKNSFVISYVDSSITTFLLLSALVRCTPIAINSCCSRHHEVRTVGTGREPLSLLSWVSSTVAKPIEIWQLTSAPCPCLSQSPAWTCQNQRWVVYGKGKQSGLFPNGQPKGSKVCSLHLLARSIGGG